MGFSNLVSVYDVHFFSRVRWLRRSPLMVTSKTFFRVEHMQLGPGPPQRKGGTQLRFKGGGSAISHPLDPRAFADTTRRADKGSFPSFFPDHLRTPALRIYYRHSAHPTIWPVFAELAAWKVGVIHLPSLLPPGGTSYYQSNFAIISPATAFTPKLGRRLFCPRRFEGRGKTMPPRGGP